MAVVYTLKTDQYELHIWNVTETPEQLKEGLVLGEKSVQELNAFVNQGRKLEYLAARQLLKKITGRDVEIHYDKYGKPNDSIMEINLSIAHSRNYVAVIASKTLTVGLDIEKMDNRIERIAHKFVNENEFKYITSRNLIKMLYLIWGAKETIFKIHSKGDVDFRTEMEIEPFELKQRGTMNGRLMKKGFEQNYPLHYLFEGEWMLVYSAG